jgi:dihydroxyacetone kinase
MLDQLLNMNDSDRAYANLQDADNIVLLVNNLGSVSALELGGITKHVAAALSGYSRSLDLCMTLTLV